VTEHTDERSVTVARGGLADLDAALSWAVQAIERENIPRPSLTIRPLYVGDGDGEWHDEYEVSVSGEVAAT
jgi:hypothetical protein